MRLSSNECVRKVSFLSEHGASTLCNYNSVSIMQLAEKTCIGYFKIQGICQKLLKGSLQIHHGTQVFSIRHTHFLHDNYQHLYSHHVEFHYFSNQN